MTHLWHRELIGGNWFVVSPDCETHIRVFHRDEPYRVERSLCRILNSTSMHKFTDSHEEMDMRGGAAMIAKWWAHRRFTRAMMGVVKYNVKSGVQAALAPAPGSDLFAWYFSGMELLVEVTSREYKEYKL